MERLFNEEAGGSRRMELIEYREVEEGTVLPVFKGTEWEEAHQAADEIHERQVIDFWRQAAIASWVKQNRTYGESSLEKFAAERGQAASTWREFALAYERAQGLDFVDQSTIYAMTKLSPTHFVKAASIKEDEQYVMLLVEAHDNAWSVGKMLNTYAHMKELSGENEREEILAPARERYPEIRSLGADEEVEEKIGHALDEMDEYQREETLEKIGKDARVVAELAGVEAPEDTGPDVAAEGAKKWTAAFREIRRNLMSVEALGGIEVLVEGWSDENRQQLAAEVRHTRELLQAVEEDLVDL